jgi:hypothetical protein
LEAIAPPYTNDFVQLFLPMVENEEITGSMRGDGDNDPVSEFIGNAYSLLYNTIQALHFYPNNFFFFTCSALQSSFYSPLKKKSHVQTKLPPHKKACITNQC